MQYQWYGHLYIWFNEEEKGVNFRSKFDNYFALVYFYIHAYSDIVFLVFKSISTLTSLLNSYICYLLYIYAFIN